MKDDDFRAGVEACAEWLDHNGYASVTLMRAALLPPPETVADVLADLNAWDVVHCGIRKSARLVERQWPGLASRLERLADAYEREQAAKDSGCAPSPTPASDSTENRRCRPRARRVTAGKTRHRCLACHGSGKRGG